jgi:phosphoribosylglycinamide formyltransferase-1
MLKVAVLTSHRPRPPLAADAVLQRVPSGNRVDFDAETARLLHGFDVVVLYGYLFVLTEPMLVAFPDRIINLHDSDLPKYPGLHATRDAILAGERETRSVAHIVTPDLDAGPVIARSEAFPVAPFVHEAVRAGHMDIVRAYAYAQREWMMRSAWAALAATAIERVAEEMAA